MAKIKYTATDALGQVHTRSSARAYTHMVVTRPSYEAALAAAKTDYRTTDKSNYHHYRAYLDGTSRFLIRASYERDDVRFAERCAKDIADAAEHLAGVNTLEEYIAKRVAEAIARVEAAKAKGDYDRFYSQGWCGRPDLAEKLAAKERSNPRQAEVAILEAVAK